MAGSRGNVLVSGCSSGIGLASARLLKARGWRVIATARRPADLRRLADEEGLDAIHLELSDRASIRAAAEAALDLAGGKLAGLFNNAAYGQPGAVEDLLPEHLSAQLEVNVVGPHLLTRQIIPAMRAQGGGRIVMCSSVLGFFAAPFRGAYVASKFALEGLTDTLRLELKGTGIEVSLIEPGPIRTRFVETALGHARANIDIAGSVHREAYERLLASMAAGGRTTFKLEPEAVARVVALALESPRPRARYRVTWPTHVAWTAKRVLGESALDWLAARS